MMPPISTWSPASPLQLPLIQALQSLPPGHLLHGVRTLAGSAPIPALLSTAPELSLLLVLEGTTHFGCSLQNLAHARHSLLVPSDRFLAPPHPEPRLVPDPWQGHSTSRGPNREVPTQSPVFLCSPATYACFFFILLSPTTLRGSHLLAPLEAQGF